MPDTYTISTAEIAAVAVKGHNRTLQGTVAENQQVFDNLGQLIADKFNAFVNHIETGTGVTIDSEVTDYFTGMGWTAEE